MINKAHTYASVLFYIVFKFTWWCVDSAKYMCIYCLQWLVLKGAWVVTFSTTIPVLAFQSNVHD